MLDVPNDYKSDKVLSFDKIKNLISNLKSEGKTVGMCHGGFDLTHPGHVKHFESAKKLCDILIVSITADRFVTPRKGSGRPIYSEGLRAYMIAGIEFVDYVVITDFKLGVDVIKALKPSYYIKGPDFIHKTTHGITAERQAIKDVGGEMKYTDDEALSTTDIIKYIKEEVDSKQVLLLIDRDGTIIENDDFVGRNKNWLSELKLKDEVVSFISYMQTKFQTTNIVVSNQTGVARRFFTCQTVEDINSYVNKHLLEKGIKINNWQYCPDADKKYSDAHPEYNCDPKFVKEQTKRKPSTDMVFDGLKELRKDLKDFAYIVVIGNSSDDKGLAENIDALYIDVNDKSYEDMVEIVNKNIK